MALAQEAVSGGFDQKITKDQRIFLYLPFMHSEPPHIHKIALTLYTALGLEPNLDFEEKHKEIIDRFGRYPHRNDVLGRIQLRKKLSF